MSLASLVLRQITRRALEGHTIAEDRVRDSELAPLDTLVNQGQEGAGGSKAFISLYVDDSSGEVTGRGWFSAPITSHLVIEIAIAAPATIAAAPGAPPQPSVDIPESSAGLEASLDILAYQIKAALLTPGNPWADLWARLVVDMKLVETFRGAEFRKTGVRFAARQINIGLELLDDPVPGAPPADFWADVVAAFAADAEFDDIAEALTSVISGAPAPDWVRSATVLGDRASDAQDLGYAGVDGDLDGAAPTLSEVTLEDLSPEADPASFTLADGQPASVGV